MTKENPSLRSASNVPIRSRGVPVNNLVARKVVLSVLLAGFAVALALVVKEGIDGIADGKVEEVRGSDVVVDQIIECLLPLVKAVPFPTWL